MTGYDSYEGGTDIYTMYLEVPVEQYAVVEPDLPDVEHTIERKLAKAVRLPGIVLNSVAITPVLAGDAAAIELGQASLPATSRLWQPNTVRLFLSHVSAYKVEVGRLKYSLAQVGISGFVAHEDIEPSHLWQEEIVLALRSMQVMAVLLTEGFHESNWTDQEVGYGLARRVVMIPVRVDMTPYGFMGSHQALTAKLAHPDALAAEIVRLLLRNSATQAIMTEALVCALENAGSFAASRTVAVLLREVPALSSEQLDRLQAAVTSNNQVAQSWNTPQAIESIVQKYRPEPVTAEPLTVDDIPF